MSNVYRLKEISHILAVKTEELKVMIAADPAFSGIDTRLLDGRRFDEDEFAALAVRLRNHAAKADTTPSPAAPPAAPVPGLSAQAVEAMKSDLVRAIYAGDRRAEGILGDLRRSVRRAEWSGEVATRDMLGRIALHFEEVCAKLNRQTKVLDEVVGTVCDLHNAVKRIENMENARVEAARVQAVKRVAQAVEVEKVDPLAWHERLAYELFMPWKLRGRV